MKPEVEAALRGVMRMDGEISERRIEEAICVMNGDDRNPISPLHYISFKELCELSGLSRGLVTKYTRLGILELVHHPGRTRPVGVTRESYRRLVSRKTRSWPPEMEAKIRSRIHETQAYFPKGTRTRNPDARQYGRGTAGLGGEIAR